MLARCPSCDQTFPVVGRGRAPCPFCAALLEIETVRRPGGEVEVRTRPITKDPGYVRVGGTRSKRRRAESNGISSALGRLSSRPAGTTLDVEDLVTTAERAAAEAFAEARSGGRELARLKSSRPVKTSVPWEDRGWWLSRWVRTLRMVMIRPRTFFAALTADRWGGAPSFAALQLGFAAAVVGANASPDLAAAATYGVFAAVAAGLVFLLLVMSFHAASEAALGRRVRWTGVGRVASYGLAPAILSVVPVVGWSLAATGTAVLHVIGLRMMLGLPWRTAVLTALMPWTSIVAVLLLSFS